MKMREASLLIRRIQELEAVLRQVEWVYVGQTNDDYACPWCGSQGYVRVADEPAAVLQHTAECARQRVLSSGASDTAHTTAQDA